MLITTATLVTAPTCIAGPRGGTRPVGPAASAAAASRAAEIIRTPPFGSIPRSRRAIPPTGTATGTAGSTWSTTGVGCWLVVRGLVLVLGARIRVDGEPT